MNKNNSIDKKEVTNIPVSENINNPIIDYTRRLTKYVLINKSLSSINEKVERLDYPVIYHFDDEDKISMISELRNELEEETKKENEQKDYNRITEIKGQLYKFEPNNKEKYTICSEYLQKISEDLRLGIGFNNTFPYFYNDCYWQEIPNEVMKEFLITCTIKTGFNPYQISTIDRVEALFKQFAYSSIIPTPEYDKDTIKINLKNGTFTIKGKEQLLVPFNSEDMFKYQLPFDYNPKAEAPIFMKFLNEVLPEEESQMILSEYLGYVLTRNLKIEKCLVLVGSGANGKSVIFDIVTALLGKENVSSSTLGQLCNENGYFRVNLTNKLLNYSSELGGKNCNSDTVKQLISNEPIMARSPYKDAFELRDYAKMMFNVNIFPKDGEQTSAYFRRFIFLDFDVTIPEEKQDKSLAKKIIAKELSGIFNWVLEGLNRILETEKFTESPKSIAKKKEVELETNTVVEFMYEMGYQPDVSQKEHQEKKALFGQYVDFCEKGKYKAVSSKEFTRRLKMCGYTVEQRKTNNQTWVYCKTGREKEERETDDLIKNALSIGKKNNQ